LIPCTSKLAVTRQPKPPLVPGAGGFPDWIVTRPSVTSIVTTGALGTYYSTAWHQCRSAPVSADPMSGC
jgi:hypothetical protein